MRKLTLKRRRYSSAIYLVLCLILLLFVFFRITVSPVFMSLAKAGGENHIRTVLYSAILSISEKENCKDLAKIIRENGKITGITFDSESANKIRSHLATEVNHLLSKEEYSTFTIPVGNITGIPLLSGRGMKIPIKIVPLGSMDADIVSDFSEAGINQTKHSVYIKIKAGVSLMSPFSSAKTETETTVPLAETIIVGENPHLYASGIK